MSFKWCGLSKAAVGQSSLQHTDVFALKFSSQMALDKRGFACATIANKHQLNARMSA